MHSMTRAAPPRAAVRVRHAQRFASAEHSTSTTNVKVASHYTVLLILTSCRRRAQRSLSTPPTANHSGAQRLALPDSFIYFAPHPASRLRRSTPVAGTASATLLFLAHAPLIFSETPSISGNPPPHCCPRHRHRVRAFRHFQYPVSRLDHQPPACPWSPARGSSRSRTRPKASETRVLTLAITFRR